jgi:hypothetical protein
MKNFNKRIKLLLSLAALGLVSTSFAANWAITGMSDTAEYGIDKSSVEKNGDMRKVWVMLDYRKVQQTSLGKPFWSSRALMEMNCNTKEVRTRSVALYSGPKLSGDMLTSEGVFNQWQVAPPNSPVFNIMRSLCESH